MDSDPFDWFGRWWQDALGLGVKEPTSVALATADAKARPSVRMVLLKQWDRRGFVVYTNLRSRKGRELDANPHAALCFHWMELNRQVRVRGPTQIVDAAEADAYWITRPRESQIGAWASHQSEPLESPEELWARAKALEEQFVDAVPRPEHWGGVRIVPEEIEFWRQGDHRLHERTLFTLEDGVWTVRQLNP